RKKFTDEELWSKVVNNDSRAFAALYNRYWQKLYKTVDYYLNDHNLAEQTVHDVFVVLWRRRQYLNIKKFSNYIFVTARYHVFKELKARKVSPVEYIENYEGVESGNEYNLAEAKLNYTDFQNQLQECLKPLPK